MEISIEILKPLSTKLITDINHDKEPLVELKEAIRILDNFIDEKVLIKDQKTLKYFYDDFLGGISKAALKSHHFRDKDVF